jgi:uncharacterized protein (DUF3820 family)
MTMSEKEQEQFELALREACQYRMPFGKFGPSPNFPNGVPICDLPYEYLRCFTKRGFPKGRLGELMSFVYQLKLDGAEDVFNLVRKQPKTSLRQKQPKSRMNDE